MLNPYGFKMYVSSNVHIASRVYNNKINYQRIIKKTRKVINAISRYISLIIHKYIPIYFYISKSDTVGKKLCKINYFAYLFGNVYI